MNYPRSVAAAHAVGTDKKALAEALLAEIPPRNRGPQATGTPSVDDALTEVSSVIATETGETYPASTLRHYRKVAQWVAANGTVAGTIEWANASWTAHREAFERGEKFEDFFADPTNKREGRARAGKKTGDVPAAARAVNANTAEAAAFVGSLSDEAKDAIIAAAVAALSQEGKEKAAKVVAEAAPKEAAQAIEAAGYMVFSGEADEEAVKEVRRRKAEADAHDEAYKEALQEPHLFMVVNEWIEKARFGDSDASKVLQKLSDLLITELMAASSTPVRRV